MRKPRCCWDCGIAVLWLLGLNTRHPIVQYLWCFTQEAQGDSLGGQLCTRSLGNGTCGWLAVTLMWSRKQSIEAGPDLLIPRIGMLAIKAAMGPGYNSSTYQQAKGCSHCLCSNNCHGLEDLAGGGPGSKLSHRDVRAAQRGWEHAEAKFSRLLCTLRLSNMADKSLPLPSHPGWKQPWSLQGDFHLKQTSAMEP